MSRIGCFLAGFLVGAAAIFGALKYHVVRADDGVHLVPKISSQFGEAFVDIRQFSLSDWNDHRSLAAALIRADKAHLLQDAAMDGLRDSVEGMLETLGDSGRGS
jgi:hypothetical protein